MRRPRSELCTRSAARALGLEDEVGTLAPGKWGDVVAVSAPAAVDGTGAEEAVLASRRDAVLATWLSGREVYRSDSRLTTRRLTTPMKLQRHAMILRVVRDRRIENQEELREALAEEGFHVTQATLSRDIRELGLAKLADPQGGAFYANPQEGTSRPDPGQILPALLVGVDWGGQPAGGEDGDRRSGGGGRRDRSGGMAGGHRDHLGRGYRPGGHPWRPGAQGGREAPRGLCPLRAGLTCRSSGGPLRYVGPVLREEARCVAWH